MPHSICNFRVNAPTITLSFAWGCAIHLCETAPKRQALLCLGRFALREHGLSSYDASYLELAIRTRLPLATGDASLQRIAAGLGLAIEN
jgi:hypothetical protein